MILGLGAIVIAVMYISLCFCLSGQIHPSVITCLIGQPEMKWGNAFA